MAAKTKRVRRPNEPTRPPLMSREEIEAAPPHVIEAALAAHEGWTDRLLVADDPGRGLPRAQAQAARQKQPRELEAHNQTAMLLREWWEELSPERQQERAFSERFRSLGRRKAAAAATTPEAQAQLDAAHEALRAAERDRKAREKMAALIERLHNPPSPDAPELIGAVMMMPELLEAVEHKLRRDSDGTYTATHQLTVEELGVLVTVLHLLRGLGSVEITGMASSARWPRREPPLVPSHRSSRWTGYATSCCSCGSSAGSRSPSRPMSPASATATASANSRPNGASCCRAATRPPRGRTARLAYAARRGRFCCGSGPSAA